MTMDVTHNTARQRFETTIDGKLCVGDYQLRGNVVWMTHTGVPPAVCGIRARSIVAVETTVAPHPATARMAAAAARWNSGRIDSLRFTSVT